LSYNFYLFQLFYLIFGNYLEYPPHLESWRN